MTVIAGILCGRKMGSLSAGVLLKLVDEMDADRNASVETRKPVLLQIRSIIPILKDGNLWPNQGFYLRVADLTHAIYASLPNDQHDMILNDRLQLGQYIYVERLERACPVPVLLGLTPIPGRHFCVGKPKDLLSNNFLQYAENFDSDSESNNVAVQKKAREKDRSKNAYLRKGRKRDPGSLEDDGSDSNCSNLSTASSVSRVSRRNWKSSDLSTIKEITETTVTKHKMKSTFANRNASVSPSHYAKCDSYDEKYCAKLERKRSDPNPRPRRLAKSPTKSDIISHKHLGSIKTMTESKSMPSVDKAGEDICWDSMSPTLSKLGKEVLRERDLALLAAAEALQEAAAAERLLKSLSTMSDFKAAAGLDSSQQLVDSYLKHQENLAQTRLIIRSLTDPSAPSGDGYYKNNNKSSVKEVFEREKQATEWAKAAVAFDLSTGSLPTQPPFTTSSDVTPTTTTSPPKPSPKQKFPSLFRRSRKKSSITTADSYTVNHQDDSTKGRRSVLPASTSLSNSLETECRKRFLSYIEKYIDGIKSGPGASDRQTVSIMNQLKRVNDWLDTITRNQSDNSNARQSNNNNQRELETWELQSCARVRNKIIMFLLNHVTRAALAAGASDTPT